MLPHNTQPPHPQPPHKHKLRPQRQRLHHIRGAPDPRIIHNIDLIAHRRRNTLQRVQTRHRPIHLPSRMITDHNAIAPDLDRAPRVRHALDPLQHKRLPAADVLPRADQPRQFRPRPRPPVPHIVDPQRARLLGLRLGIDARGREPLLKHGVREAQIRADALVEGVVARRDVVVPPAELPRVGCEDAGGKAGLEGPGEERDRELVVVRHVELVEAGAFAVGGRDVFDGCAARGAEAVGEVELFGDLSDGQFAQRVVDFVDADRRKADWRRHFVPEDRRRRVPDVGVDELAGDDAVPEEGLAVG